MCIDWLSMVVVIYFNYLLLSSRRYSYSWIIAVSAIILFCFQLYSIGY